MQRRPFIWTTALLLVAVFLFFPWNSRVAPAVRVQVLDENGNPARHIVVTQRWGHFNFSSWEKAISRTDGNGHAEFPMRSVRANLLSRIVKPVYGVIYNEGIGPYAEIHAYGEDPHVWTSVGCSVKDPMPTEMRLKRRDVALYP